MSYITDKLQQDIRDLKYQKADTYQLDSLERTVYQLKEQFLHLQNEISYLQIKIQELEERNG